MQYPNSRYLPSYEEVLVMWNRRLAKVLTIGVIAANGSLAWSDEDEAAAVAKYLPTARGDSAARLDGG
jgi:hypothetical protein